MSDTNHDQERSSAAAERVEDGVTARLFQGRRRSIDSKADGLPVMEADRASEQVIGEHIAEPEMTAWDIALFLVLQEAGGRATCWAENVTAHGENTDCSDGLIHNVLLSLVNT